MYGVYVPKFHYYPWELCRKYRDIHDNLKDIQGVQGSVDSAYGGGQGSYGGTGIGFATGNVEVEHDSSLSNVGNTSITTTDAGAVAAGLKISEDALAEVDKSYSKTFDLLGMVLSSNKDLAAQTQQGEVTTLAKTFGWIAAGLLAVWGVFKLLGAIFGGREAKGDGKNS